MNQIESDQYNDAEINFRQGKFYVRLEKYKKALPYFLKSLEINPVHTFSSAYVGLCYFANKKYEKSLCYFNKAITIPRDVDFEQKSYEKNLKTLRKCRIKCIKHLEKFE